MRREEGLRVACRRESPHGPLALGIELVGVRSPVIERAVLPMFHPHAPSAWPHVRPQSPHS